MTATRIPEGEVAALARSLGRPLELGQARGLADYLGLLETWNRRMNLVGPAGWREMLGELVADSWHLADLLAETVKTRDPLTLDYGAGAGIPGVPLRLFWKAGRYVMIEPRAKRAGFLRQCLAVLRPADTEVFEGRSDALTLPGGREKADVCLSRAFKPWREFLDVARAVLGPGGLAVVFANQARPENDAPGGFELLSTRAYPSRGRTGYFWVFGVMTSDRAESLKMMRVAN